MTQEITADSADFYYLPVESAALEQSMLLKDSQRNQLPFTTYLLNQLLWSNPCNSRIHSEIS